MPKDLLEEMLNDLGIDLRVRAEQLSLEEFAKISDYISNNI
jgi:16S rRNA A1518/A1519 N6-dimethyltransferase RsmA/KsgA/DIM1 with predicted DNA glycosylase/AP lyase activity